MSATDLPAGSPSTGNPLVDLVRAVEQDSALDGPVSVLSTYGDVLADQPALLQLLRGNGWLGHSLHPALTDFPLGTWMSAAVLDVLGPDGSEDAARRLIGLGILGALPTALAGLADWRSLSEQTDRRTGAVHAAGNAAALAAYACSWIARRRGRQRLGVALGLLGAGLSGGGAYLGGHLVANGTFAE